MSQLDSINELQFPTWGLLPKQETGVTKFLNKYPEFNGSGIRIVILDSGIDPGAPGLQWTPAFETKIIERYDCSGCGDVDTSTVAKPDEYGYLTGLTGRKLKIPEFWNQVMNNEYHIGVKNAFDLYPAKLKERIETERKEKLWDPYHKEAVANAVRAFQKFNDDHKDTSNLSESEMFEKEDLEYKVEFLSNCEKKYNDVGPVYDCVVFNNGQHWMACIDTTEEGNLQNGVFLKEYSKTHTYAFLTSTDRLNISVNIHDEGNVLEIVGLCSGHGTHVASIAAGCFPEAPEKNGAAPGAKVISLTIGDGRLGSMETGTALVRAMIKIIELHTQERIHVINMSYGEHANWSTTGRIGELMNEVVNKYGIVWVASAGNNGPALCTIGTPPDIFQSPIIGVGAYVSPEMMVAEYALRQKMPSMVYTWTSRGPTIDGSLGVSVCAPGAAITSVPNFTLRSTQLLNGTSMAAPHVAGAICLILSGLEKQGIKYSPYSVKRALENTALYNEKIDRFAQGHGLLQVEKAYEYLISYENCPSANVRFAISWGSNNGGVHIRSGRLDNAMDCTVTIEPLFIDYENETDAFNEKILFNLRCILVSEANYLQCPSYLAMQNLARSITIKIEPSSLDTGVYYTSIDAFDDRCIAKGPIFRIPVTIVQPIVVDSAPPMIVNWKNINFKPNTTERHFLLVPDFATWAVLRLRTTDTMGRFMIHCIQILPKQSCKSQEFQKLINVSSENDSVMSFPVRGGLILEVVVAKFWASLGDIDMDYSISFHGIKPDSLSITMQAADGIQQIDLRCLKQDEILPVITLKAYVQVVKPIDAKVGPLSIRDLIPKGRQIYELILTYEFNVSKATEVVPSSPLLCHVLYESDFESQLWMLFDNNKQMLSAGDAYPCKYNVKLDRGDYIIKLCVRHEKKELLEKLMEIPMLLSKKLSSPFQLDVYSSYSQAITQGKKMTATTGNNGSVVPIYISPFLSDKTKMPTVTCNYFHGTITYARDELGKKAAVYPFKYIPVESPKKNTPKNDKDKTKFEEYTEALRDLKISYLTKIDVPEQANMIYEDLKSNNSDFVGTYIAMLDSIDPLEVKRQLPIFDNQYNTDDIRTLLNRIIEIANIVINSIDLEKMLANLAIKNDLRPDANKLKNQWKRQKTALVDALARKGIALCRLYVMDRSLEPNDLLEQVAVTWRDMLKFVDLANGKVTNGTSLSILYFHVWHAAAHDHYGRLLKCLLKLFEEKPQREVEEKIAEVCELLGWQYCARHITRALPVKYPPSYRLF